MRSAFTITITLAVAVVVSAGAYAGAFSNDQIPSAGHNQFFEQGVSYEPSFSC
ncbi:MULTISPECIES: hypothetical protein [Larsenimonas]|uniref:Uncharacterized protein n=1 Tax=Larsenimonas suaedae TaxID=1851019 RepID=A0ABU1GRJ5_9GAMM|nr:MULTISPECIES: hypothetical protein [Larsenimonas]MCM2972560.1 hypothetical protein [Larsenimonas suaedae]MCM5704537.1 hypothetical protein [Larsenimonas salina]MDR5894644.1 hypothetical protein [Larsenimonas suaedae]